MTNLNSFKAYDIRGRIPDEINESLAYDIGRAYAAFVKPKRVAVGYDIRLSSPQLAAALKRGLMDCGVDVLDIGLWGTEGVVLRDLRREARRRHHGHREPQPARLQRHEVRARGGAADQRRHRTAWRCARSSRAAGCPARRRSPAPSGRSTSAPRYLEHLLGYVDREQAAQAQGGGERRQRRRGPDRRSARAAPAVRVHQGQSSSPTAPSRTACRTRCWRRTAPRPRTSCAARARTWAWPGTATTTAASSSTRAGSSSRATTSWVCWPRRSCAQEPGARIVHDPRLTWNTLDIVRRYGGTPVLCKSGHAFIKQKMREVDAAYGGEMSAHHYFRQFSYCDSGMIPWLLVLAVISERGLPLSAAGRASACGSSRRAVRSTARLADRCEVDPGARARAL